MLLNFATKLDAHLARFTVLPSKQWKLETAVNTVSCKAACGESFSVRLLDASNTHELKWAEVKDPSAVMQMRTRTRPQWGSTHFSPRIPARRR